MTKAGPRLRIPDDVARPMTGKRRGQVFTAKAGDPVDFWLAAGHVELAAEPETVAGEGQADGPEVTPAAAAFAQSLGLDIGGLTGTGAGGKVTKGDVENSLTFTSGDGVTDGE